MACSARDNFHYASECDEYYFNLSFCLCNIKSVLVFNETFTTFSNEYPSVEAGCGVSGKKTVTSLEINNIDACLLQQIKKNISKIL